MTDKLKRLREWAEAEFEAITPKCELEYGRERAFDETLTEINRLLAEPEAAPTDAEVEAAIHRLVDSSVRLGCVLGEGESGLPELMRRNLDHSALLDLIARRVAAAKADDGLIGRLRDAINARCTCGGAGPGEGCQWCDLWHEVAAREAGGAK